MNSPPILLAAPHRLPFLAGSLGLGSTAAWWLGGLIDLHAGSHAAHAALMSPALLHGPAMILLGYAPFILGFLLTVIPRWIGQPDLSGRHHSPVGILFALGVFSSQIALWLVVPKLLLIGLMLISAGWAYGLIVLGKVLRRGNRGGNPHCWHAISALAAVLLGLSALMCLIGFLIGTNPLLLRWSNLLAINGLVLPVFLTVAHRMVPFFARMVVKDYLPWRPDWLLVVIWFLLSLRLFGEAQQQILAQTLGSAGLALVSSAMIFKWWPREKAPGLLNVLLWGFVWAPVGFAMDTLAVQGSTLGRAPLHALLIGFAGSMLVAMVTRVTQGHSGRPLSMFSLAWIAFAAIQLTAALRIWAALHFEDAAALQLAIGAFLLGLAPWLLRNALVYVQPRIDGRSG